jgi:hypothetical protein
LFGFSFKVRPLIAPRDTITSYYYQAKSNIGLGQCLVKSARTQKSHGATWVNSSKASIEGLWVATADGHVA